MVDSTSKTNRRRLRLILLCGLLVAIGGVVVRLIATGKLTELSAARMNNEKLAQAAAAPNASFTLVFEWGRRLEALRQYAQSMRVYARAMEIDPAKVDAWVAFGRTAFASGDWGKSETTLKKAVEQWPDNADAHFNYATVLASTMRIHAAREELAAGIKLNSTNPEAYRALGNVEMRLKNAKGAVEAYRKVKELDPKAHKIQAAYGEALLDAGINAEALKELELALKDDPSDADVRFNLGRALAATGKEPDQVRALQEFNRVTQFSLSKSRAYVEAARLWKNTGDQENATQSLEHAIDLDPYNIDALQMLIQNYQLGGRQADARRFQKDLDEAQEIAKQRESIVAKIEAGEDQAQNLVRLARLYMKTRNINDARAACGAASLIDPTNAEAAQCLRDTSPKAAKSKLAPKP